ncbi:hypothetical protein IGI04_041563 [Brassica rapa subsp. trilocularis]|uniref:Uncharacterized protein n=1 Tax=Brassica rapa subsp. trilocularis TaxID=1813537 RepID=A0ABQ7KRP7_BRACM|nr:hypothetical protein IGI04_041563 [Brassica rapa subsp. trilocularis]
MALNIPFSDSIIIRQRRTLPAQKGGTPHKRIYNMTPILQISASEYRQPKVSGLERSLLVFAEQQKVLRLQIPVNNPHGMTSMHNLNNGSQQGSSSSLRVMPFSNNPIEQLSTSAKLHDQMHRVFILISSFKLHNVRLTSKVMHYLHFPSYILNVFFVHKLPFGNGLASELLTCRLLRAEVRDAELSSP